MIDLKAFADRLPHDRDLWGYLGCVPYFPEEQSPPIEVEVSDAVVRRRLSIELVYDKPASPRTKRPPIHPLPRFAADVPDTVTQAPEYQVAALLRLLRPGFFGVDEQSSGRVDVVRRDARSVELSVELPRSRPELVMAISRALKAFSLGVPIASGSIVELGLAAEAPRAAERHELVLGTLPFEVSLSELGGSSLTVEANFVAALSRESNDALFDLFSAFYGVLMLGCLPGSEGGHAVAELDTLPTDTLPDQWQLGLDSYSGSASAVHPLLEGLARVHESAPLTGVELVW